MGWSESERGCQKHPTANRTPGVCSDCLRERLSQLSDSFNTRTTTFGSTADGYSFFSTSSTAFTSHYSSGGASPARGGKHHRNASEMMGSIALFFSVGGGGGGLKKSRSIAFIPKRSSGTTGGLDDRHGFHHEGKTGKKKTGFWSKLLGNTGKRNKEATNFRESFRI